MKHPGYFHPDLYAENQTRYPNLALLDERVQELLSSDKARGWATPRMEVEICRIHPVYYLENYAHIREAEFEGGLGEVGIIPFKLNTSQLILMDKLCAHLVPTPWERIQMIVLKHRKVGTSTLFACVNYWFMRFIRNFNTFAIADLGSHTDNIIAMMTLCHDRDTCGKGLPIQFSPPRKLPMPRTKKGFRLANGSMVEADSGENSNPGTSGTIQGCHMSENSKWRDPLNAETSLLNSVPTKGFVFLAKESTAFGLNKWAQDWDQAEKSQSNWEPTFVSWKDLPDCEYELLPGENLKLTREEKELTAAHGLRPGHIKFRRAKIEQLNSVGVFRQDYPLDSREPFLVTGSNYFPMKLVIERITEVRFYHDWKRHGYPYVVEQTTAYRELLSQLQSSPRGLREALAQIERRNVVPENYMLNENDGRVTYVRKPDLRSEDGALTVFKLPQSRVPYLVIVDVAEGIQSGEYTSDNSIIEVLDTLHLEQVAEWGGNFDEEMTAYYASLIGRMYGTALIVVEMNNKCGGLLWGELKKLHYPKLYYRQVVRGNQAKREPGWETTVGNKKEVCGRFRQDFKNGIILLHSLDLLEEMSFFLDNKGKLQASSDHTDDRVMAMSVGDMVISLTPSFREPDRRHGPGNPAPAMNHEMLARQRSSALKAEMQRRYR